MYLVAGIIGVLFSTSLAMYCRKAKFSIGKVISVGSLYSLSFVVILNIIFLINGHLKNLDLGIDVIQDNVILSLIYCSLCVIQCCYEVSKE